MAQVRALTLAYTAADLLCEGYWQVSFPNCKMQESKKMPAFWEGQDHDSSNWRSIIVPAVPVSIDVLTVGFGLGTLRVPVFFTVAIRGAAAAVMTMGGFIGEGYSAAWQEAMPDRWWNNLAGLDR